MVVLLLWIDDAQAFIPDSVYPNLAQAEAMGAGASHQIREFVVGEPLTSGKLLAEFNY